MAVLLSQERLHHHPSIDASCDGITSPLRMGHQPEHIPRWICDSGDVRDGTVGIAAVLQGNAVMVLKGFERVFAALITAFSMGDRQLDPLSLFEVG